MLLLIQLCAYPVICQDLTGQQVEALIPDGSVPVPSPHYLGEYIFDSPSDPDEWNRQGPGLHMAFVSSGDRYMRRELPEVDSCAGTWEGTGWRGERMNIQLLVWSADTVRQIRVRAGDLTGMDGSVIGRQHISPKLVRYVVSDHPYDDTGFDCESVSDRAWLMPDRLEDLERFDLPARTVRPVWITIDVPRDAQPGTYSGHIFILHTGARDTLAIILKVQDQVLPPPGDWKFRLDLWQNPWVVAEHFRVAPWSEEHLWLLRKHLCLYAEAGGTFVTTYAVHSPWADNSYTLEGSMIEWIRNRDGSWDFDFSVFDTYVRLCAEVGIDRAITIYTPVPWGHRFRYMDRSTGEYTYEIWDPGSATYEKNWNTFLDRLKHHLDSLGWFPRSYLGINENPLDITLSAIQTIKRHSPHWKITYAGNWHSELSGLVDDYSPIISAGPSKEELEQRSSRGHTSTFYVCCHPPKPNNFVFSPPEEGRFMGWYAASMGFDGFLRWAYDAWPADPDRDARHTLWPAGDCFLVYPGGNSSIRFEKLREGIVDFEKIRILCGKASISGKKAVRRMAAELEMVMQQICEMGQEGGNIDRASIQSLIEKGDQLLVRMSDALSE